MEIGYRGVKMRYLRSLIALAGALVLSATNCFSEEFAAITLLFDDSAGPAPHAMVYLAGNWDKRTGEYRSDWEDYNRVPMHDDGQNNDGAAGDGIWGYVIRMPSAPGTTFEWACDRDEDKENGWLGTGPSFSVTNAASQSHSFPVPGTASVPATTLTLGAPRAVEGGVLFTFDGGSVPFVYLAGEFNNWAENDGGKISNPQFRMTKSASGIWYAILNVKPKKYKYKFVKDDGSGNFDWSPDPFVADKDAENNSIFDFSTILSRGSTERRLIPGRVLLPLAPRPSPRNLDGIHIGDVSLRQVWVQPGESAHGTVTIARHDLAKHGLSLIRRLKRFDGSILDETPLDPPPTQHSFSIPTDNLAEGGYLVEFSLEENGNVLDRATEILTVARDISDDLRYGFYANWADLGSDYAKKSDFFARLHINGVEYYDYFPAHGHYAPTKTVYEYEPFGVKILGEDIRRKIDAGHDRNILSIAYIAAYASSQSIYNLHPYPMTTREGVPRIFNGAVMSEDEARRQNKPIWFYLMAIAKDSKWYPFLMEELQRALDDSDADIVSFDGFEIDSYGHGRDDRYYSEGSRYSGVLLSEVIRDLVGDVRAMTHAAKRKSTVSFNCVNEYGIENMYDVTDFIFIENWSGFKSGLDELVDICYRHRAPRNQRVVVKLYPADAKLDQKTWTEANLKYILGATLTGGGSLMVAGEPDEAGGVMHALNTLYYPDNVPMPERNFEIIKAYNFFDAQLYRITHGRNVTNFTSGFELPGCIVREFDSDEKFLAVQILHNETNWNWSEKCATPQTLSDHEIAYKVPDGRKPVAVYYGTPDFAGLMIPRELDWEWKDGHVRTLLPRLETYGALLIKYE